MNKVFLSGRTTRDAEVRYTTGDKPMAVARVSLAVDGYGDKTNFINLKAFGKKAEAIDNHVKKGTKINVIGSMNTESYTNKDGQKVYITEVLVEEFEFCEPKRVVAAEANETPISNKPQPSQAAGDGFMDIPNGIDEELPFN